jgi:hypothetical protein
MRPSGRPSGRVATFGIRDDKVSDQLCVAACCSTVYIEVPRRVTVVFECNAGGGSSLKHGISEQEMKNICTWLRCQVRIY